MRSWVPLLVSAELLDHGRVVRVGWDDATSARFHADWLRDNALDPTTRDPRSGQRLLTIHDVAADTVVTAARIDGGGVALTVTFGPTEHTACFPTGWLLAQRYDRRRPDGIGWTAPGVERWTQATIQERIPVATWSAVTSERASLGEWLGAVDRFGFAVLTGMPVESGRLCEVAELFGYVRHTNYGRWFDVRASVDASNLAYTNLGLQAHTDNPYRDPVPTLQLLACLENTVEGGASSVVDGFAVAERLQCDDPEAFALLARYPARFEWAGAGDVRLTAKRPVIELGPDGELLAIRFNNRSMAPTVDVGFDVMPDYLAALRRFAELVDDPSMAVRFRLEPGELFIVDNTRVLHARTAFSGSGTRWLQGCYSDLDGLRSTLAVLRREASVEQFVSSIVDVFERRGAEEYLGEAVTMAEHMLQAAALAVSEAAADELVLAALLHDIGHFTGEFGTYSPDATRDHRHEIEAVRVLAGRLPQRVVDCVRLHVAAKRYLCAVEPEYLARLSPASVHTLELQGGPMSHVEVVQFEAEPHHADAVRVRRWDDGGKLAGSRVPALAHYVPMLRAAAELAAAAPADR